MDFSPSELCNIEKLHAPPKWLIWQPLFNSILFIAIILFCTQLTGGLRILFQIVAAMQLLNFYSLMHQASHGALSKNLKINFWVGKALGMLLGTTFTGYQFCHLRHHKYLRTEKDPQEVIHIFPGRRNLTAFMLIIASLIGALVFIWIRVPKLGLKFCSKRKVYSELLFAILFHLLVLIILFLNDLLMVIVPILSLAIVWGSMIDIVYHQGLSEKGDHTSSRSLYSPIFGRWVLNGENWHAEHHKFPNIPCCHLPAIHELVKAKLQKAGVCYEKGYVFAFLNALIKNPFFLPKIQN